MDDETDIDPEILELLEACKAEGPNELIPDGDFEPTDDARF